MEVPNSRLGQCVKGYLAIQLKNYKNPHQENVKLEASKPMRKENVQ